MPARVSAAGAVVGVAARRQCAGALRRTCAFVARRLAKGWPLGEVRGRRPGGNDIGECPLDEIGDRLSRIDRFASAGPQNAGDCAGSGMRELAVIRRSVTASVAGPTAAHRASDWAFVAWAEERRSGGWTR